MSPGRAPKARRLSTCTMRCSSVSLCAAACPFETCAATTATKRLFAKSASAPQTEKTRANERRDGKRRFINGSDLCKTSLLNRRQPTTSGAQDESLDAQAGPIVGKFRGVVRRQEAEAGGRRHGQEAGTGGRTCRHRFSPAVCSCLLPSDYAFSVAGGGS